MKLKHIITKASIPRKNYDQKKLKQHARKSLGFKEKNQIFFHQIVS